MDDASIAVVASPAERITRDRLTHAEWGQRLSIDEFVQREERLRATAWARSAMQTWLLVPRDDRTRVLASLETFRVRSRHDGAEGWSYEVASVFTEPALRGQGHASRLLDLVVRACPEAQAFTLYSDVGESLYARGGFVARPAWDLRLPAERVHVGGVDRGDPRALLISRAWQGRFALLPDAAQLAWHRERERVYAELLGASMIEHAVLTCAGGHALLAGDLKHEQLYIVDLVVGSNDALHRLVDASRDAAARAGLSQVVLWETPAIAGRIACERVERDGALPMMRPLIAGLDAGSWMEIPRLLWV
ncbi:MAG: GNAT family N-acetyltransferase [Polyangia bacterium]